MKLNNQLKSIIQWKNPSKEELFIKFSLKGEEIINLSKLILLPGQGCIVTNEGKIESKFDEAGIYDIYSDNKPFITSLKKILQLQEGSEHVIGIWFYRKANILNMRWGTPVPISYTDPIYTFPILLSAFGNYSIKITKPKHFFEQVVAGKNIFCENELKEIFLSRIIQPITDYLANSKFSYIDIDSKLNKISNEVKDKTKNIFNSLGFDIIDFRIEGTQFDKETLERISKISDVQAEVKAAQIAGINYTTHQQLQAMRDAANNNGSPGLLLGINAGNNAISSMKESSTELKSVNSSEIKSKLETLKSLFEEGLIDENEYKQKKQIWLSKM